MLHGLYCIIYPDDQGFYVLVFLVLDSHDPSPVSPHYIEDSI